MAKSEDEKRAYRRDYYLRNKERLSEQNRIWRENNADKIKVNLQNYYQDNKEKTREYKKRYAKENKEAIKARCKAWYAKNRDSQLASSKARRIENKDSILSNKRLKKYGISAEQWDALFASQNYCCAVCSSASPNTSRQTWHTDHCHVTGEVRGILCAPCNVGLGRFKDDVDVLNNAIAYLKSPPYWSARYP